MFHELEKSLEEKKIKSILLLFLLGAAITDLWKDKIYNFLVIPCLLVGITAAALGGTQSVLNSLLTIAVAFLVLLPVYFFKGIAAGDVKLFMSVASYLSMQELYSCILSTFLIAGAISVLILIIKRNKKKTIHFAVPMFLSVLGMVGGLF